VVGWIWMVPTLKQLPWSAARATNWDSANR
jgi:hypothetical protein